MYTLYAYDEEFNRKPDKKEIGRISKGLSEVTCEYTRLAEGVGTLGMTFAPASFNGSRKMSDFKEEQIFALDFDDGITYKEIQERLERYQIPILFAYKTFSWKPEHEKFRIVMGFSQVVKDAFTAKIIILILMEIFPECDGACKDPSRMFFGGRELLYLNDEDEQLLPEQLLISFDTYLRDKYGETHYTRYVKEFYRNNHVLTKKKDRSPVFETVEEGDRSIFRLQETTDYRQCTTTSKSHNSGTQEGDQKRRSVIKNFDWNALYHCCQLYRDFVEGKVYYHYPELFHIALNLCCVNGGRKKFMEILNAPQNAYCSAYFDRDWDFVLNDTIKHEYYPMNCRSCPHANVCTHNTNMLSTAKPTRHDVKIIEGKAYCSIEEAEESLEKNMTVALRSRSSSTIKLIIAQTGLGKTQKYLEMLRSSDEPFLIVVPTHRLKYEVFIRAREMGVKEIAATPPQPQISDELQEQIDHYYEIGAGELAILAYKEMLGKLRENSEDHVAIKHYLEEVERVLHFSGHVIMTHQRFLYLTKDSKFLRTHRVIIDEDIFPTVFGIVTVDKSDIHKAMQEDCIRRDIKVYKHFKTIYKSKGDLQFGWSVEPFLSTEMVSELHDVHSNIFEMCTSRSMIVNKDTVVYLRVKPFPCENVIIMSATASPELYKKFFPQSKIKVYKCKETEYIREVLQYTNRTYSRACLNTDSKIIEQLKEQAEGYNVITFLDVQKEFDTEYHFGGVEGLDCIKGEDLCVIGMPNVNDVVYRLYGMYAGVSPGDMQMKNLRVQYNGYDFSMFTYENETMQTIQCWYIESLLEQAVGRARLLRYDCEVKVYSGFPVAQAKFVKP